MKENLETVIRMFRKSLFKAFYNWLEVNKEAIGEKWYNELRSRAAKADADTAIKIMATSMWMFNMISGFGVLTGIGPPPSKIELQGFNEKLDKKATMRLLYMIQSCMALQYLPKEIATAKIPVITAKQFSLKLYVDQHQP